MVSNVDPIGVTSPAVKDAGTQGALHVGVGAGKRVGRHLGNLSWDSMADFNLIQATPWSTAKRVVSEAGMCLRLAVRLYSYLGIGYNWTVNFWRLVLYAMLLLPGFIRMIYFYFMSPRVVRSVPYGRGPRQRLDLYMPENMSKGERYPVVVYITGGAWTIGYKAWGALLARRLSGANCLVACLDYRNFPQGDAHQMLEDINTGISWVCRKCERYYGDPDNIVIVGQSAGGHLSLLAMLRQAEQALARQEVTGKCSMSWNPQDIKVFVGVSGAYDLAGLAEHLHQRGLYKNLFSQIMSVDGAPRLHELSPLHVVRGWDSNCAAAAVLPPLLLVHGCNDKSVPHEASQQMHQALLEAGADSTCRLVERRTHTSFILEGMMMGGRDVLMDIILPVISPDLDMTRPHLYPSLCPMPLCLLAGYVCPF